MAERIKKMTGSAKQIAWAEDIRRSIEETADRNAAIIEERNARMRAKNIPLRQADEEEVEVLMTISQMSKAFIARVDREIPEAQKASWWIDNKCRLFDPIKMFDEVCRVSQIKDISPMESMRRAIDESVEQVVSANGISREDALRLIMEGK